MTMLGSFRSRLAEMRLRLANWRLTDDQRADLRRREFTRIFSTDAWNSPESVSGSGSTLGATEALRPQLVKLFAELSIGSVLDAPCGDCNWMAALWPHLRLQRYVGIDIVEALILRNRDRFQRPGVDFQVADLCRDPMPEAQLVLCRDCLIHLSLGEARAALANLSRSGTEWLLVSSDRGVRRNREVPTGSWRPIDLEVEPFSLPGPDRWIPYRTWTDGHRAISSGLGLWRAADVRRALG